MWRHYVATTTEAASSRREHAWRRAAADARIVTENFFPVHAGAITVGASSRR
jgi:hypothetical protein